MKTEKKEYIVPEAQIELIDGQDVVLISVDTDTTFDIDKENSVSWINW